MSANNFQQYFTSRLSTFLENTDRDAMSEEAFRTLMNSDRPKERNLPLWKDGNLLKRPAFFEWISEHMEDGDRVSRVYERIRYFNNLQKTVSIINAGKLADNKEVRSLAYSLEEYMLNDWNLSPKEWSLSVAYKHLGLNKIRDLDELLSEPAFTTWQNMIIYPTSSDTFSSLSFPFLIMSEPKASDIILRHI